MSENWTKSKQNYSKTLLNVHRPQFSGIFLVAVAGRCPVAVGMVLLSCCHLVFHVKASGTHTLKKRYEINQYFYINYFVCLFFELK